MAFFAWGEWRGEGGEEGEKREGGSRIEGWGEERAKGERREMGGGGGGKAGGSVAARSGWLAQDNVCCVQLPSTSHPGCIQLDGQEINTQLF